MNLSESTEACLSLVFGESSRILAHTDLQALFPILEPLSTSSNWIITDDPFELPINSWMTLRDTCGFPVQCCVGEKLKEYLKTEQVVTDFGNYAAFSKEIELPSPNEVLRVRASGNTMGLWTDKPRCEFNNSLFEIKGFDNGLTILLSRTPTASFKFAEAIPEAVPLVLYNQSQRMNPKINGLDWLWKHKIDWPEREAVMNIWKNHLLEGA